jgi:hypothetical protein
MHTGTKQQLTHQNLHHLLLHHHHPPSPTTHNNCFHPKLQRQTHQMPHAPFRFFQASSKPNNPRFSFLPHQAPTILVVVVGGGGGVC